jgi:periplasmic divalent cation tolerance protein
MNVLQQSSAAYIKTLLGRNTDKHLMGKEQNPDPDRELSVLFSTVPAVDSAAMAKSLVDRRLVACVNVLPVRSYYRWKGEFCDEEEHLLIVKTRKERIGEVMEEIRLLHPYEVPEIIALPVIAGHLPYIQWVYQETRK